MSDSSWVSELVTLPPIARRGISPKEIGDVETDFPDVDLAFEARSFVAWWGDGTRRLTRPYAAWRNWLRNARKFEAPADLLEPYRKSYGRYLRSSRGGADAGE